ncbi:MAG TPA: transcriptional regulator [Pseudomonas sp.]|uniref:anti-sigma factor family protein n=1 Tax=Pseudomonas sp. TaxID=306 RepID=UPI002ED9E204
MNRTTAPPSPPISDEMLVAWLDGELDAEQQRQIQVLVEHDEHIAQRVAYLHRSDLPFKAAFKPLLEQAPVERLQEMLKTLPRPAQLSMSRRAFLARAAGLVIAGVLADRLFIAARMPVAGQGWRASVAQYMALYTPQTLDNLAPDGASHSAQLTSVGQQLGLPLDPQTVALPGAEFKRAQTLDYDGVPIGQLTYLDARHGPLALCITAATSGPTSLASEQRLGMNVVYWSSIDHAYMLIGRNPLEDLKIMARSIQRKLPA